MTEVGSHILHELYRIKMLSSKLTSYLSPAYLYFIAKFFVVFLVSDYVTRNSWRIFL